MNLDRPIRSQKVLRSARGQQCSARFPSICNGDPETTVWAHLNGAAFGKGLGLKAHDILGFHACATCHAYTDTGHGTHPILTDAEFWRCILDAVCETYVRLARANIIIVPLDLERLSHDKPTPPRKPKAERAKVPAGRPLQSRGEFPPSRPLRSRNSFERRR